MNSNAEFTGKTLLVTGGGGDIGKSTALYFAERGARVAIVDLRGDAVQAAVEELRHGGAEVEGYDCDVTASDRVVEIVASTVKRFGSIDYLFNNAGYQGDFRPAHEYSIDDFRKVIETNLVGAFVVLKTVAAEMVKARFGRIVNMASRAGTFGPPNMVAYGASKAGVIGLTLSAAKDLAPHNVRVNSVGPALLGPGTMWDRQVNAQAAAGSQYFSSDPKEVEAQMIRGVPMRRLGSHTEVASTVAFLMSEASSYITGVHLPIGGGLV